MLRRCNFSYNVASAYVAVTLDPTVTFYTATAYG